MKKLSGWPQVLNFERTPLVDQLLEILKERDDYIKDLEVEINRLKKLPSKPKFELNKKKKPKEKDASKKRAGSEKKAKTQSLAITETHTLTVNDKPKDARFKGYRTFTIQDL